MKKLLSAIFVISSFFASAQFPQGINYQSIIRNTSGVVLPSTAVTVEFKLYSSPTFTLPSVLLYDETHSATTNSFGMVNLVIGQGTAVGGLVTFNNIPWIVAGVHYEVWVNSSQVGTRQPFMSVPYAMNALTADWAPSPTLSVTGNTLTVGSNTVTIPTGLSYTAGTGIAISGNTITNNAPDQTVSVTGLGSATVTGTYPNFTIETPTVAAATPPTITGAGSATVTSSGNTFTVNTPVPQVYTAGNGIDISSGGVISNTATAITPTITGTGAANVTSAGNTFTVDVPAAVTPTITGAGSATVTSAGNSFTVDVPAAVTPTITGTGIAVITPTTGTAFNVDVPAPVLNYNQGTKELTITQGSAITTQTLNGTGSNTVSIVGSDLATVTPTTGSSFTVSVPTPSLNVVGGSLTGTYPTQTLTIPSSSTTLVQGNNVTLNQAGNTYTVSSPSQSLTVNSNSLSITGGNTVTIPTSNVVSGNPNIVVNQSGNTYSVSAVPQTLSIASNSVISLTNGGSVNITPAVLSYTSATNVIKLTDGLSSNTFTLSTPTLALSGTTLTSGASTNSVNLATLPGLWSASSTTAVVLTTNSNNVGIGTVPASQFKLDVAATAGNSVTIHGFNTGATDAFAAVFGENSSSGIGVYAQSNGGKGVFGKSNSGSGVYGESTNGDAGKFILPSNATISNAVNAQTNGTGAALYAKSFNAIPLAAKFDGNLKVVGNSTLDSSLMMSAYSYTPGLSTSGQGRIFFNGTKFMVSENTGLYKPLFGATPWVQGVNTVTLTNINDKVGIGTAAPNAALEVAVSNTVTDGIQINMNNAANGGNALQVKHFGIGNAGYFNINNTSSNGSAIEAGTDGTGRVISATQNGTGEAGHFFINNVSNVSSAVWARTTGGGPVYTAEQFGTGRAIDVRIFGSTNNQSVIFAQTVGTGPAGYFETSNTSGSSNAVAGVSFGTGDAIFGNHLGTSGSAGHFNIPGGSSNTSPALLATNIASGNALTALAGAGSAITASNSSSVAATIHADNAGIGDVAQFIATQGRAIYASSNSTSGYSTAEFANNGSTNVIFAYKNAGSPAGNVAQFANNEPGNASDALQVFNSGTGAGISSSNTNASPTSYAGVFDGGITTKGKTTNSSAYAFRAFNSASTSLLSVRNDAIVEIGANVGINILNPTNRLHVNSSYANAAIFAENITSVSTASVAHGVLAKASSTHSLAAAVYANNIGAGPSVYGVKNASEDGIAGRFELVNTSGTADAVFAINNGGGAAIHAVNGPTVTGGTNYALMVENGHIKTYQTGTMNKVDLAGSTLSNYIGTPTDVAGTINIATGASHTAGQQYVRITFSKPYTIAPIIILTAASSGAATVAPFVTASTTDFIISFGGTTPAGPTINYTFNYMVIEGR